MYADVGVVQTQTVAIPVSLQNVSTSYSKFRVQISLQREGILLGMVQQPPSTFGAGGWVETTDAGFNSSVISLHSKHPRLISEEYSRLLDCAETQLTYV